MHYNGGMVTKAQILDYLGGEKKSCGEVARKLGYKHPRSDNNIRNLPDVLSEGQADAIIMRMKANRIKVPKHWTVD